MPKLVCTSCGGKGRYQVIGTRKCFQCNGTGRNLRTNVINSPFNPYCTRCNGKRIESYNEWKTCGSCHGKGYKVY